MRPSPKVGPAMAGPTGPVPLGLCLTSVYSCAIDLSFTLFSLALTSFSYNKLFFRFQHNLGAFFSFYLVSEQVSWISA